MYKPTLFDKCRLHMGGIALVFMLYNSCQGGMWIRAMIIAFALAMFLKLESSLYQKK
nr:MAG TPA: DNA-binding domain protain [Caudoviricetes sp.]